MPAKRYTLKFDGYWREPNIGGLPARSGIYCVYACTDIRSTGAVSIRKLLYIGESTNVRKRISEHRRWNDWKRQLLLGEEICCNAALIGPASDRQRVEPAMIYRHKPPCNDEYVDSFPFDETTVTTTGRNAMLTSQFTVYPTRITSGLGALSMARPHRR